MEGIATENFEKIPATKKTVMKEEKVAREHSHGSEFKIPNTHDSLVAHILAKEKEYIIISQTLNPRVYALGDCVFQNVVVHAKRNGHFTEITNFKQSVPAWSLNKSKSRGRYIRNLAHGHVQELKDLRIAALKKTLVDVLHDENNKFVSTGSLYTVRKKGFMISFSNQLVAYLNKQPGKLEYVWEGYVAAEVFNGANLVYTLHSNFPVNDLIKLKHYKYPADLRYDLKHAKNLFEKIFYISQEKISPVLDGILALKSKQQ